MNLFEFYKRINKEILREGFRRYSIKYRDFVNVNTMTETQPTQELFANK